MRARIFALIIAGLLLASVIGCGSNNTQTTSNSPTPGSPSPTPTPTPTPTPGPKAAQYEAALLRPLGNAFGQIIVNANEVSGNGQVQETGGNANAAYTIIFEPYNHADGSFQVATVNSDASGNINAPFKFPQKGTFSGILHLSAGTNSNGEIDPMDSGVDENTDKTFNAPLVQASKVTPTMNGSLGTDPLVSGVVVAGTAGDPSSQTHGKLHAELHGAAPNATYEITECGLDGQTCGPTIISLMTDASGNGAVDQDYFSSEVIVFNFLRNGQIQFVTGFTVQ